jgi:two-component system chemotaxis response regulator CheB
MGDDGMRGARAIHERGGRVLVQDEATSVVWGMPGAVANAGLASAILPLPAIAEAIQASCGVPI